MKLAENLVPERVLDKIGQEAVKSDTGGAVLVLGCLPHIERGVSILLRRKD